MVQSGVTVKLCVACAASMVAVPPWFAAMVHVPAAMSVMVLPETVHVASVSEENVTARPEVAVAETPNGGSVTTLDGSGAKRIDWPAFATVKLRVTVGAAWWAVSPAWLAAIVQVPAAVSETVLPDTEQTNGV